ncbi:MAG: 1,4-dihydroxy-2-naphthoate octaprenyltransferase [Bacteroidota bacterium]
MHTFKSWVLAARLRTLPLSLSGIIAGTAFAQLRNQFDWAIFALALLTTIGFQITSNFANDYGDGIKGTDAVGRVGPKRALQEGLLGKKQLLKGIWITAMLSLLSAIVLLYKAFFNSNITLFWIFTALGLFSIWAAIRYTMGDKPYGYQGLGDLFVFLFFGLLAVMGTSLLYTKLLYLQTIPLAICFGLLCVGVLNLNNLRDHVSDAKHGKRTMVVKLGFYKGKVYHLTLILGSFIALLVFVWAENFPMKSVFFLLAYIPIFIHLNKTWRTEEPQKLDPELKKLALSTFLLAVLLQISVNYFL